LNASITGEDSVQRVVGLHSDNITDCYGADYMTINGDNEPTTTSNANGLDGATVTGESGYNSPSWWSDPINGPGFVFGNSDTAPWKWDNSASIPDGSNGLPRLWWEEN
jgi:hypothetical protein